MRLISRIFTLTCIFVLSCSLLTGCSTASNSQPTAAAEASAQEETTETSACPLEDGVYTASFHTDSSMFRVNEACDGRGVLTVEDGQMTIHVILASVHILNLYPGTAEEAKADEAGWLTYTEEEVTYSDGMTEEAYGFDIPVPYLDEDFPCAIIGTKGNWYDHMVSVSDAEPAE